MVEFIVDGVGYELPSLSKVDINYDASQLCDVTSGCNVSDLSFTIELNESNAALLSSESMTHNGSKFNDSSHWGEISVEGQTLLEGKVVLSGGEWSGDSYIATFTILGDSDSWADVVVSGTFNSIDMGYTKQLTDTMIKSSWEEGSVVSFLPVTRDEVEYEVPSSQSYSVYQIRGMNDYHPFLHIKSVVDGIFGATEYDVESDFMQGELFQKLYMSGSYAYTESSVAHSRMGFYVTRTSNASTTASSGGRVYASPSLSINSVGSVVDVSSIDSNESCYSNGGAIALNDGVVEFTALYSTTVGFEFRFAYVASYRIESRETLSTFNRIYVGDSTQFEFTLHNSYVDQRDSVLTANFTYTLVIFDFEENCTYSIVDAATGISLVVFTESTVNFSTSSACNIRLKYYVNGSDIYFSGDWALYSGWVSLIGEIEVDVTFCSAPSKMSAGSTRSFNIIFFDGGESGDTFTLLERTSIRPIFASYPGYGNYLSFEDIARHDITQADFLSSLQHLFNLRFYTDRSSDKVYIEPYDTFYDDTLWDWSDRVVIDDGVKLSPLAADIYQERVWRYQQGEASMEDYADISFEEYGVWSSECSSQIAKEGTDTTFNSLFYPSVNDEDGILYVGERYDDSSLDTLNITPRIVIRDGYCQTTYEGEMPYATFHDGECTLCFEDRDSLQGLNQYYLSQTQIESRSEEITLSIRLAPDEFSSLFSLGNPLSPSIRSSFILSLNGEECRGRIERIEWYDTSEYTARITFIIIN